MDKTDYLKYVYAKPNKLLVEHCLETGWTAYEYLTNGFYKGQVNLLAKDLHVETETLVNNMCFFTADHDVGKAHPIFQSINMPNPGTEMLTKLGLIDKKPLPDGYVFRHEQYSGILIEEYIERKLTKTKTPHRDAMDYGNLISSHHQGKKKNIISDITGFPSEDKWKEKIINPLFETIEKEFPFTEIDLTGNVDRFFHFTLGLIILCDRIASSSDLTEE